LFGSLLASKLKSFSSGLQTLVLEPYAFPFTPSLAGFFCRWELLPDYPELTLTVDYSNLLPDESITLYLAPSNVIQLRRPLQPERGGIFQTSVWVERSIFVEFQTTRTSTSDGETSDLASWRTSTFAA
jgi:hypothetical protein